MRSPLQRPGPPASRARALLVGVWRYQGGAADDGSDPGAAARRFADLHGPEADIDRFGAALADGGVFHADDIETLPNPSRQRLSDAVETFFIENVTSSDVLLLYFSGHGFLADQDLHLCPTDALRNRLSRMVPARDISVLLERTPAREKIVVLDCCFAAEFKGDLGAAVAASLDTDLLRGTYVLGAGQRLTPDSAASGEMSPFTRMLVDTLADRLGSGLETVDMGHLYEGVTERAKAERLPLPERKVRGQAPFVLGRRSGAAGPGTTASRPAAPTWPRLRLRIDKSDLVATLADGNTVPARTIERAWPQPVLDELLAKLIRLASNPDVAEQLSRLEADDPAEVLAQAMDDAYQLVGEELFHTLFADARLRGPLFGILQEPPAGAAEHVAEIQLDLTEADPRFVALPWELMAVPPGAGDMPHPGGLIAEHRVLIDRRVATSQRRESRSKAGDAPLWPLVRSDLPEDNPIGEAVVRDLCRLAETSKGSILVPTPQVRVPWGKLSEELPSYSMLVLCAEISGTDQESRLHLSQRSMSQVRGSELVNTVAQAVRDGAPLQLIVLETVPRSADGGGFAATNGLARKLVQRIGCPVVAVHHPHAYVQWLKSADDEQLRTMSGYIAQARFRSKLDACLAHEARQAMRQQTHTAGIPVVYLPDPVRSAARTTAEAGLR